MSRNSSLSRISSGLVVGGIAGFVGTMAMTMAMRRLHRRLPADKSYPLTPREIVDSGSRQLGTPLPDEAARDVTLATHFGYGAAMGALIGAINPDPGKKAGAAAGVAVWLASYMGWIPAVGNLKPATSHPPRRNLLMIAVHLVWGTTTAAAMRELSLARKTIFAGGADKDAPPKRRRSGRGRTGKGRA